MTTHEAPRARVQVNTGLLMTGAVLAGIGSLLGAAGLAVSAAALAGAFRHWVDDTGVPPTELAKQQWSRAKAATTAGASAWRQAPAGGQNRARRPGAPARRA